MQKSEGTSMHIVAARHDVELAKSALRDSVSVAAAVSTRFARRVADTVKPVLVALAGVGLLVLVAGVYGLTRRRHRPNIWRAPVRRSLLREMLRAALVSASARLASAAVIRAQAAQLEAENPRHAQTPQ